MVPMGAEPCGAAAGSRASRRIPGCFQGGEQVGAVVGEAEEAPQVK